MDYDLQIIGNMFDVIRKHRIWKIKENKETLASLGSTKQSDWRAMLLDGKLPGREERLFDPLNNLVIFNKALSSGSNGPPKPINIDADPDNADWIKHAKKGRDNA